MYMYLMVFVTYHQLTEVDLGEGCRECTPPPSTPQDEAFFIVFNFKICLFHQSVAPFLSAAPLAKKNARSAPNWSAFGWAMCKKNELQYKVQHALFWQFVLSLIVVKKDYQVQSKDRRVIPFPETVDSDN